jgi:hypothetical protein
MWRREVYDRTVQDIERLTVKAYFNLADWTRIYENAEALNDLLNDLLELGVPFTTITEPIITDMPDVHDLNDLLENIELLRLATGLPNYEGMTELKIDWEGGTRADSPTYVHVNQWEYTEAKIKTLLSRLANQIVVCGVPSCGQSRLWQQRFRRYYLGTLLESSYRFTRTSLAQCGASLSYNNRFRG